MTTQRGARCPECGSQELLTVTMTPQGERISFSLCNACGWKWWGRGEEGVQLSSIQVLFGKRPRDRSKGSARRDARGPKRR